MKDSANVGRGSIVVEPLMESGVEPRSGSKDQISVRVGRGQKLVEPEVDRKKDGWFRRSRSRVLTASTTVKGSKINMDRVVDTNHSPSKISSSISFSKDQNANELRSRVDASFEAARGRLTQD